MQDKFDYFQCAACQCLQIEKFPPNIAKYYPQNYHSFESPEGLHHYYTSLKWNIKKLRFKATFQSQTLADKLIADIFRLPSQYNILKSLSVSTSTRLLDVGCGTGYYIYPLYEIGMHKAAGIDPFILAPINYSNGLIA